MSPDRNSDRQSKAYPDDNDDADEGNTNKFKQGISNLMTLKSLLIQTNNEFRSNLFINYF